jgi:hypothetical protein
MMSEPKGLYDAGIKRSDGGPNLNWGVVNLDDEIKILRVALRRVFMLAGKNAACADATDGDELIENLDVIGKACGRLGRLVEIQTRLEGKSAGDEMFKKVQLALSEVRKEIHID